MGEPTLRERVVEAMQRRIDRGDTFQAQEVVTVGVLATPEEGAGVMRRQVWGRTHTFINGEPLVRIADKLLQKNRKAGRISFKAGWWSTTPVSADTGAG